MVKTPAALAGHVDVPMVRPPVETVPVVEIFCAPKFGLIFDPAIAAVFEISELVMGLAVIVVVGPVGFVTDRYVPEALSVLMPPPAAKGWKPKVEVAGS